MNKTLAGLARIGIWGLAVIAGARVGAAEVRDLWKERLKSVVAVEFFTEMELDRRPTVTFGLVVDDQGTIILQNGAVNVRAAPNQLKDFRVYIPGAPPQKYTAGTYLGQSSVTGWHFVRVAESLRGALVPITRFAAPAGSDATVKLTDSVWGMGLRGKDEDFAAYYLEGKVAILQTLPLLTAVCLNDVAAPGLPVFNQEGIFVGVAINGFGQTFMQFSGRDRGGLPVVMINMGESSAFQMASEIMPYFSGIPNDIYGRPVAWLGVQGLQPVDPEVAGFLKVENACVVSEVLAGSPADQAGFKDRDMIVAMDGKPLPRLKPDRAVVGYVELQLDRHKPGDVVTFGVQRGAERVELSAKLVEEPKMQREAERKYFDRLGFTAREFVYMDGVARRAPAAEHAGLIAHFVKANSPVSTAGLQFDDWIKEIDGVPVRSYAEAAEQLAKIESDANRNEVVLLIRRGGETQVLRAKLK